MAERKSPIYAVDFTNYTAGFPILFLAKVADESDC